MTITLAEQIFQHKAAIAFLQAQLLCKLPTLIRQLEMLEHRDQDDDLLIAWLRGFLPESEDEDDSEDLLNDQYYIVRTDDEK